MGHPQATFKEFASNSFRVTCCLKTTVTNSLLIDDYCRRQSVI